MKYLKIYDDELISLTEYEKNFFYKFKKKLKNLKDNKKIKIITRGINFKDIFDALSISKTANTYEKYAEVSKKLFMVGEKSKYFLFDKAEINPEDISNKVFEKIFDLLGFRGWNNINFYIEQNEDFFNFFCHNGNKSIFMRSINAKEEKIRFFIRDYYLILLHQLNCSNFKEYSFLLSTTENFDIAKSFVEEKEGIVLFSWKTNVSKKIYKVKDKNIPMLEKLPFEEEQEITEYRGLFPHYIYGFQILKDDKFVVNHNLFSKFNRNIEEVIKRGILFNQSKFNEVLGKTKYKKYFSS